MAMTDVANQATWYHSFLMELGYSINDPIPLHGDNKGTIHLALNPVTGDNQSTLLLGTTCHEL
jgi:predicted neuraminidase